MSEMTLKEHRARFHEGMRLLCVDHCFPDRAAQIATITRAGSTVCEAVVGSRPYRMEHVKASELVRCDAQGFRVETTKPNGTPMRWEWRVLA